MVIKEKRTTELFTVLLKEDFKVSTIFLLSYEIKTTRQNNLKIKERILAIHISLLNIVNIVLCNI